MPKLTDAEQEAILTEDGKLMHVATVDQGGAPLVTTIWFIYEDGKIYFTPRRMSEWLVHIRHEPRVSLCITEEAAPYRKVVVRGTAEILHDLGDDDAWRDRYRRLSIKYVGDEAGNTYVDTTDDQPRALCAVTLDDAEVRSWRMPIDDEAYKGIWASRYYTENAKMNEFAEDGKDQPSLG
jgi:PPOX class probable F420-dependent enzyme